MDCLHKMENVQPCVVNYIRYRNDKPNRENYDTTIQLLKTCSIKLYPRKKSSNIKETCTFFLAIRTNCVIRDFIKKDLVKFLISYTVKK